MASAVMLGAGGGGDGEGADRDRDPQGGDAVLPDHDGVAEPPQAWPSLCRPLLSCMETAWSWRRPGLSAALFLGSNAVFWFLALTPWRLYSLVALSFLLLVTIENIKALTLYLIKGWKKNKNLNESWKVTEAKQESTARSSQCIAESWMSCTVLFEEMASFKKQNPGKFCLLVCSLCTFCAVIGRYIPGALVSYFLLLCFLLWPLVTSYDLWHRFCTKAEPVLQRLDFGLRDLVQHLQRRIKMKQERLAERKSEDESEADTSALCPKISSSGAGKELSISDTELSETSWTENGTFNLSGGHTPQTDASDDLDRPSDHEEAFARDLPEFPSIDNKGTMDDDDDSSIGIPTPPFPTLETGLCQEDLGSVVAGLALNLSSEQSLALISTMASGAIAAAVTSAMTGPPRAAHTGPSCSSSPPPPPTTPSEDTDTEDADDFELLDESELEQIESELGLGLEQGQADRHQAGNDGKPGFLSNLLGGGH
ncbi:reticulophagy regulator 1 [Leucoraja erinacea]|uniref:reticulophagy regulator 1 n=1 Tax=Leucoraja erinaceus TaxID=7782 RepID=UPI002453CE03|nr:reticulophagy regulator 1 [Leucoraja erinacea]